MNGLSPIVTSIVCWRCHFAHTGLGRWFRASLGIRTAMSQKIVSQANLLVFGALIAMATAAMMVTPGSALLEIDDM